jgi:chromosome segregation ATPase
LKTSLLVLLATLSVSALAQNRPGQIERPCDEFDQKLSRAQGQVRDFDKELRKLENKIGNIEERLATRTQVLSSLLAQRESINNEIRNLGSDQINLRREVDRLQAETSSLDNTIRIKETQRQRFQAAAAAASNLEIKRENLREAKRLEKEIESLQANLSGMNQSLRTSSQRANQIDQQVSQRHQQLQQISQSIEAEQRDPAIARLQQERIEAINELSNAQISLDGLNDQVSRATNHVTMCYGYLELSVKYPAVLRISKKLVKQGCVKFKAVDQGSELENEAQTELLNSACQ